MTAHKAFGLNKHDRRIGKRDRRVDNRRTGDRFNRFAAHFLGISALILAATFTVWTGFMIL